MKLFKLVLIISTLFIYFYGCSGPQTPPNPLPVSKEVTFIEGIEGKDYKFLAWGIGEDNEQAEKDALKAAVWAVLVGGGAGKYQSLMNVTERAKNEEFLKSFFANDDEWSRYVRSSNQGRIDPDKRLKLESGKVKLGIEAIVAVKMLREDLEARGILSGMKIK